MVTLVLACSCILLVSATDFQESPPIETGPYELKYPANFGNRFTIPDDNPLTKEGVYLGRLLFYEPKLSSNNKVSCATCHQQRLAFTDGKAFSKGVDEVLTKRSSMSLANILWVRNLFWDGRSSSLETQAITPLTDPHEMGQSLEESSAKLRQTKLYPPLFKLVFGTDELSGEQIVKALSQFERTLISCQSPYDRYLRGEYQPTAQEQRGMSLFMTPPSPEKKIRGANCGHCHGSPKTFIELFHNNGLDSIPQDKGREQITLQETDRGRFRVPTLRNIALTAPYMHDGRFNTLEEVLDHYSDHIQQSPTLSPFIEEATNETGGKKLSISSTEKEAIIAFLHMLTDSTFISESHFSDPHLNLSVK